MVKVIKIAKYQCLRCGHSWIPRSPEYPRLCPKCKSVRWDRERKVKNG